MRFCIKSKSPSSNRSLARGRQGGFTLIEMMIVVGLIAILSSIALPTYNNYVNRAKIKSVQSDLVALSLNFENDYQRKLSYPAAIADLAALEAAFSGWSPASENFEFSSTAVNNYTLTATGTAGAANGCIVTLAEDGTKTITACDALGLNGNWL